MTYSEKIKLYCKDNKLTIDEFAEMVDVSKRTVYRWISGELNPSLDSKFKLNELFGILEDDDSEHFVIEPKKPKDRKSMVGFTLTDEQYKLIKEMSRASGRSMSFIVGRAIEFSFKKWRS